jgi:hypothetical protein
MSHILEQGWIWEDCLLNPDLHYPESDTNLICRFLQGEIAWESSLTIRYQHF